MAYRIIVETDESGVLEVGDKVKGLLCVSSPFDWCGLVTAIIICIGMIILY